MIWFQPSQMVQDVVQHWHYLQNMGLLLNEARWFRCSNRFPIRNQRDKLWLWKSSPKRHNKQYYCFLNKQKSCILVGDVEKILINHGSNWWTRRNLFPEMRTAGGLSIDAGGIARLVLGVDWSLCGTFKVMPCDTMGWFRLSSTIMPCNTLKWWWYPLSLLHDHQLFL